MSVLLNFLGNSLLSFAQVLVWYNIMQIKIPYKDKKFYIQVVLLSIATFLFSNYLDASINGIGIMLLSIVFCKIIIRERIKNCVIVSFMEELLLILAEALFAIVATTIFNINIKTITNHMYITDIFVAIITILLSKIRFISKSYGYIKTITENIKIYQLLMFFAFTIFGIGFAFASTYLNHNIKLMIIVNVCISIFYTTTIILIFRYQYKYYTIKSKYNLSIEGLQSQEEILNEYRILNHENKNNLRTIRNMTTSKKIVGYINSLLKDRKSIDNRIITETLKLPSGGIRGLVYSKIMLMQKQKINYFLNIDRRIKNKYFENLSDDDIVDICQILGVYLDNAIEETMLHIDDKEYNVNINFTFINDEINVSIGNNYSDINKKFISSKGKNRGYGLKLVKKVIDKNQKLCINTQINKNTIIQQLMIKI